MSLRRTQPGEGYGVLLEVGLHQLGNCVDLGSTRGLFWFIGDVGTEVVVQHLQHQPVHRSPGGSYLGQHVYTLNTVHQALLQRSNLPADTTNPGEKLFGIGMYVRHGQILYPAGVPAYTPHPY